MNCLGEVRWWKVPFVLNADRDIRGSRRLREGPEWTATSCQIYINALTIEPGPLRPQFTDVDTLAHQLQFFLPLSLHNSITTARMRHGRWQLKLLSLKSIQYESKITVAVYSKCNLIFFFIRPACHLLIERRWPYDDVSRYVQRFHVFTGTSEDNGFTVV